MESMFNKFFNIKEVLNLKQKNANLMIIGE